MKIAESLGKSNHPLSISFLICKMKKDSILFTGEVMGRALCKHKGSLWGHQLDKVLNLSVPLFSCLQNGYSDPCPTDLRWCGV